MSGAQSGMSSTDHHSADLSHDAYQVDGA
jgi:hypothetical protein